MLPSFPTVLAEMQNGSLICRNFMNVVHCYKFKNLAKIHSFFLKMNAQWGNCSCARAHLGNDDRLWSKNYIKL